jgi:hypothetical protein
LDTPLGHAEQRTPYGPTVIPKHKEGIRVP